MSHNGLDIKPAQSKMMVIIGKHLISSKLNIYFSAGALAIAALSFFICAISPAYSAVSGVLGAVFSFIAVILPIGSFLSERLETVLVSNFDTKTSVESITSFEERHIDRLQNAETERKFAHVRIANFSNFITYAPLYVADKLDLFKEEGLSIELVQCNSDASAVNMLKSGRADIAITDPTFCFEKGVGNGIKIVSPFICKVALWFVSKEKISDIDPQKRTILRTYPEGSTAYVLATNWKRNKKLDNLEIQAVEFNNGEDFKNYIKRLLGPIDNTRADILLLTEPEVTWMTRNYPYKTELNHETYTYREHYSSGIEDSSEGIHLFTAILSSNKFFIRDHKSLRGVVKAIRLASYYLSSLERLNEDTDQNREINQDWITTIEGIRKSITSSYPEQFFDITERDMARIVSGLVAQKMYPSKYGINKYTRRAFDKAMEAKYSSKSHATNALLKPLLPRLEL